VDERAFGDDDAGMTAAPNLDLEAHDLRTAPDAALDALHTFEVNFEAERRPDEPPVPRDAFHAQYRALPAYRDALGWLASENGDPVACIVVDLDRKPDNDHILEAWINVASAHRQRGIARRLLEPVVETADREGRRMLWMYAAEQVPAGAAFLERVGATPGLAERESELDLTTLDRGLVERWVAEGPSRASAYELVLVEGDIPDELVADYAELYAVTNTAPRDDIDMQDEFRTPDHVREQDRSRREGGRERILYIARERTTGALAGWTELGRHPAEFWKVEQYWTAVHPDHRGVALGKWLKAAALERAFERWPDAKKITTGNAYSNDAMLGINNQLGFREIGAWMLWQTPVDRVREYLGA
jgi:mycothiol synthase